MGDTKFSVIAEAFSNKTTGFGKQMEKSQLLSRTSRCLHEMKKKLLKLKNETLVSQTIDKYLECFKFTPKKANEKTRRIKRSAIDDKKVADFFNGNSKDSIYEILSDKQRKAIFDDKMGTFIVRTEDDFEKMASWRLEDKIKEVVVREGIKTIKEAAFYDCKALESINLGNVQTIENMAFSNCTALKSIDLGNVTTIGCSAFYGCKALESINFGEVTTIETEAFLNCPSIEKVTLPQNGKADDIKDIILIQNYKPEGNGENGTIKFVRPFVKP